MCRIGHKGPGRIETIVGQIQTPGIRQVAKHCGNQRKQAIACHDVDKNKDSQPDGCTLKKRQATRHWIGINIPPGVKERWNPVLHAGPQGEATPDTQLIVGYKIVVEKFWKFGSAGKRNGIITILPLRQAQLEICDIAPAVKHDHRNQQGLCTANSQCHKTQPLCFCKTAA